jgi:hypothetical protein
MHRSGGSIEASKVKQEFDDYSDAYGKEAGIGIKDRSKTVHLVVSGPPLFRALLVVTLLTSFSDDLGCVL